MAGRWRGREVALAVLLLQPFLLLLASSPDFPPDINEARAPGTSKGQGPPARPGLETDDEDGSTILDAALSGLDEDFEVGRGASSQDTDSFDEEKEGQSEDGTLQSLLDVERAYFLARDFDGDGRLSKSEFVRELRDANFEVWSAENEWGGWETWNISERKQILPDKKAFMYGKDWTATVPQERAEEAYKEYDTDEDGFVTWKEWRAMMFHSRPQIPEFKDGHEIFDPSGILDNDISPQEIARMKKRFEGADANKDALMSEGELFALFRKSHDEPEVVGGIENYVRPSDDELHAASLKLLRMYDMNNDTVISMQEWLDGGGF